MSHAPEIHATEPGNCPKCGMKLIEEKPKQVAKTKPVKSSDKQKLKVKAKKKIWIWAICRWII